MDFLNKFGEINSVYPPTKYLTFGPWIYLVPQYEPKDVLILGYGDGTVAGLIKLLYGDIPITGVDIEKKEDIYNVEFIQANAKEFVKTCKHYDSVIIDLFSNDINGTISDFVLTKEFALDVSKIADYIIINTLKDPDMSNWDFLKRVNILCPNKLTNKVYYYQTKTIPDLLP